MIDKTAARQKMEGVIALLRQDLLTLKAGRANPAMIERILVEAYESKMPLVELATISAPDASSLLITPFDLDIIRHIEKALAMDRGLGLSPSVDGNVIRIKIPPLTEETRKDMVKLLGQKLEGARIMVRQVRSEKMREIRDAGQGKELNQDEVFRAEQELQKLTDEYNAKIEEIGQLKEKELMGMG